MFRANYTPSVHQTIGVICIALVLSGLAPIAPFYDPLCELTTFAHTIMNWCTPFYEQHSSLVILQVIYLDTSTLKK
jgi:hypothetical protein